MPDASAAHIARLSYQDRLKRVIEKTLPKLPAGIAEQLKALLAPEALAVATAIVIVWAALHFTGVGEVADAVLICTAWATLGAVAWQAGKELIAFAGEFQTATSDAELNDAAEHLARAIDLIGVQALLALLLHAAPKPFANRQRMPGGWRDFGAPPRSLTGDGFISPASKWSPLPRWREARSARRRCGGM